MNPSRTKRSTLLLLPAVLLLLAALACGPVATVVVTATPTPEAPTPTPAAGALPSPAAETPPPEPTTAAGCTLGARWVADVTVPDNAEFAPGTPFDKTWRVRNTGTCTWEPGTKLVFISGEPMGGPAAVDVPALAPGAQTDVSVSLVAPATPGTYRGNYQFQAPDGTRFGAVIWVQIVVPAPATAAPPTEAPTAPPPTEAPTAPPPTEAPTAVPTGPDLYISELTINPPNPQSGDTIHVRVGTYNKGNQAAGPYKVTFRYGPQPWNLCTWDVPGSNAHGGRILECDALVYDAYTGVATTDADGVIAETDESNNTAEIAIPIPAATGVDLYISEMSVTPANPRAGETITARIGVYNRGNAPAGAFRVYWRYGSGDFDLCDWGVDGLAARGGRILTCNVVMHSSFDTVATADARNQISEAVEANNRRVLHVEVSP